jgi:predicted DNA-binding transcriptional regulator AlpA
MEDRLLYRVPEVAVILNVSRSKVYGLFSSGDLESSRLIAVGWCGARIYAPMLMGFALSTSLRDLVITS